MASSKQQNLSIYGAFYLPLAVLTGLTLSVILPAALTFLMPAMDSALFISLPLLWDAFLSWVTPPCLFFLLNGIIVVLTATSGVLSSSESNSASDFYTNLLGKMENSHKAIPEGLIPDSPASDSYTNLRMKMSKDVQKQISASVMVESHLPASPQADFRAHSAAARVETHIPESSQEILCAHTPCVLFDAHGVLETEHKKVFDEEEDDGDHETPSNFSRLAMGSRSFSHVCAKTRICEEEEEEEEEESDERICGLPKLTVENKSFSFSCRSEPSSPQFATPSKSNMIKRSLSIDSASFHDNQASSCTPEDLSDEAFRKRVEDFISKMNAQLRSEAK